MMLSSLNKVYNNNNIINNNNNNTSSIVQISCASMQKILFSGRIQIIYCTDRNGQFFHVFYMKCSIQYFSEKCSSECLKLVSDTLVNATVGYLENIILSKLICLIPKRELRMDLHIQS